MSSDRPFPLEMPLQGTSQRNRINQSRLPARKPVAPPSSRPENVPKQSSIKHKPITTNQNGPTKLVKPAPKKKEDQRSMFSRKGVPPTFRQESLNMGTIKSNIPQKTHTPIFEPARTPSLVSGSSVSTGDSPRSNMLRRKASFGRAGYRASPDDSSPESKIRHQISSPYEDMYSDTVLGISLPPISQRGLVNKPSSDLVINLDQFAPYPTLSTLDLPPPTPLYAMSATSSSRLSPDAFSISSTPTSMTCYSPATCTSGPNTSSVQIHLRSPSNIRPSLSRNGTSQNTINQDSKTPTPARQSSSSSGSTGRAGFGYRGKMSLPSSPKPVIENGIRRPVIQSPPIRSQSPIKSNRLVNQRMQGEQSPPELAYLKDASPMSSLPKLTPSRPSRDGTPDIRFARASPVIQSNMSSLPSVHKRQGSSESRKSIDMKNRFVMARKSISREPSPGPNPIPAVPATVPRRMTPDIPSDSEKRTKSQPSPKPEKPQSRFGFFKRSKTEPDVSLSNKEKEKRLRKGPSAGTGHEGYGKFAARGRSGSTTSGTTSIGRSSSADSSKGANTRPPSSRKGSLGSKGGPVLDDFLVERLNPITLRGTGPVAQSQERGPSSTTPTINNSEVPTRQESAVSPLAVQNIPSAISSSKIYSKSPETNNSSNSINTIGSEIKSNRFGSLSVRRSSRKSLLEQSPITALLNNSREFYFPAHPATDPLERKLSEPTLVSAFDTYNQNSGTATNLRGETESPAKVPKKWNFFQRTRTPVKKVEQELESIQTDIPHQPPIRAAGHYAMMDAPRKIDVSELEKIMMEADDSADDPVIPENEDPKSLVMESKHGHSILLPAPPPFIPDSAFPARPESPKIVLQADVNGQPEPITPDISESPPKPRGSRLAQVGRIPRVVSRRERDRKPSISSFSRPFHPSQPSPALHSSTFTHGALPLPPRGNDSNEHSPLVSSNQSNNTASTQPTPDLALLGSGISSPNSLAPNDVSGLAGLVSASPVLVLDHHDHWGAEDVWDEYNDLLDSFSPHSPNPPKTPRTPKTPHTGSSLGAPFQYSNISMLPNASYSADRQHDLPTLTVPSMETMAKSVRFPSMRESESFMRGSIGSPLSPASITDFLDREGIRKSTASGRLSIPSTSRLSSTSNRFSLPASVRAVSSAHKRTNLSVSSVPETAKSAQKKRDSLSIQKSEIRTMGFENMANLRFGALMTSKWLSFGRVLFSPAHYELKGAKEDRVLVLDGLGKGKISQILLIVLC